MHWLLLQPIFLKNSAGTVRLVSLWSGCPFGISLHYHLRDYFLSMFLSSVSLTFFLDLLPFEYMTLGREGLSMSYSLFSIFTLLTCVWSSRLETIFSSVCQNDSVVFQFQSCCTKDQCHSVSLYETLSPCRSLQEHHFTVMCITGSLFILYVRYLVSIFNTESQMLWL